MKGLTNRLPSTRCTTSASTDLSGSLGSAFGGYLQVTWYISHL